MNKMEDKLGVYKISLDFGRMGDLSGLFVEKAAHVKMLINENIEVYFGEVLGKHSEISATFNDKDIELLTEDENIVKFFQDNDISIGHNPFEVYIEDEEGKEVTIREMIESKLTD
jgi:hypothetical protein